MDDGGLYIRGQHPFDMAPHEWLRVATAWVMRAARITFKAGSLVVASELSARVNSTTLGKVLERVKEFRYSFADGVVYVCAWIRCVITHGDICTYCTRRLTSRLL